MNVLKTGVQGRKSRLFLLAVPISAALVGLCAGPSIAEPSFVGIWFSAYQPDEPNVMSLIEFKADGNFYEEFRKCENGDVAGEYFEQGKWTIADGVEHTVTTMINGEAAKSENSYAIELLTDTERRIRMQSQSYVFVSHRVEKFEFPSCPTGA